MSTAVYIYMQRECIVDVASVASVASFAALTSVGIKQLRDGYFWCKMDLEATADQMVTLLTVNPQRV